MPSGEIQFQPKLSDRTSESSRETNTRTFAAMKITSLFAAIDRLNQHEAGGPALTLKREAQGDAQAISLCVSLRCLASSAVSGLFEVFHVRWTAKNPKNSQRAHKPARAQHRLISFERFVMSRI